MKTSQITIEANNIINDIFSGLKSNNNKDDWKKALSFIGDKVYSLETTCGDGKFIWRKIRVIMTNKYGSKFITKK